MTTEAEGLEALLAPVAAELGFDLVRLEVMKVKGRPITLQILAERPDGTMPISDCARLSRAFAAVLDEQDPLRDAYNLEVGSPGLDRPLLRERDYERFRGREARIELHAARGGQRRFKGLLEGFVDGKVLLRVDAADGPPGLDVSEPLAFLLDDIVKARLIVSDAFLKMDLDRAEDLDEGPVEDRKRSG